MAPAKGQPMHPKRRRELVRWGEAQGFPEVEIDRLKDKMEAAGLYFLPIVTAMIANREISLAEK